MGTNVAFALRESTVTARQKLQTTLEVATQCSRAGVRVRAPKARQQCTKVSWQAGPTITMEVEPNTFACTLIQSGPRELTRATRTVRSCTVLSTKTQARWTRTMIMTPRVSCASTAWHRRCTCSGAARAVQTRTRQYTTALSWLRTTSRRSLRSSAWTGSVRPAKEAAAATKTAVCCTRRRWRQVTPVKRTVTTPRRHVQFARPGQRTRQCTRGGVHSNVPVARENCTRVGLEADTMGTTVVVPTSCACTLCRRSLMARAPATRTVRCCTVQSTRTQARWTRITTRMPDVSFARKRMWVACTCSGVASPAPAATRQSTGVLSWLSTTRSRRASSFAWTGSARTTKRTTMVTKTVLCCTRPRWKVEPLMRRLTLTTTRLCVRCVHRANLCTPDGVRNHVTVKIPNCTTASWRLVPTTTTVAVTTPFACTLLARESLARAVATRTVRCCTVWSMRTQVRWTRTTIRMPRARYAEGQVPTGLTLTCSGAARAARTTTRPCTMA